jgi:hypothetical protein
MVNFGDEIDNLIREFRLMFSFETNRHAPDFAVKKQKI